VTILLQQSACHERVMDVVCEAFLRIGEIS